MPQTTDQGHQKFLLFHSLFLLVRSDLEMLSWPNSPLLVLLQFVDPDVLSGDEQQGETRETPLHELTDLADPSDYSTHVNQLILAKQLIEHGANVNAVSIPQGETPLHSACYTGNVTNLDFVEFLLEACADPNAQGHQGHIPLLFTIPDTPGAAKFLVNWHPMESPSKSGFVALSSIFSFKMADHPDQIRHKFLFKRWSEKNRRDAGGKESR
jgi:hypothetical protein